MITMEMAQNAKEKLKETTVYNLLMKSRVTNGIGISTIDGTANTDYCIVINFLYNDDLYSMMPDEFDGVKIKKRIMYDIPRAFGAD